MKKSVTNFHGYLASELNSLVKLNSFNSIRFIRFQFQFCRYQQKTFLQASKSMPKTTIIPFPHIYASKISISHYLLESNKIINHGTIHYIAHSTKITFEVCELRYFDSKLSIIHFLSISNQYLMKM